MSVNRVRHNMPAKTSMKQPLSVSNVTQNIGRQKERSYAPPPKRMSKDAGSDGFYQPPDKRRKTEQSNFDDWGDDDFTEDQLENIDEMVMLSQQVRQDQTFDGNHNSTKAASVPLSSRALGKGTNRSQSASDVQSRVKSLPAVYPTNSTAIQGAGHQQRKPTATGGSARQQSTPNTAASGQGGQSPNMPVSCASTSHSNKELEAVKSEKDYYKKEVEKLRGIKQAKEGQISLLSSKLTEKEKEVNNLQRSRNEQFEQAKVEKSEREKSLQKDLDRLKAQLQFTEQELTEMKGNCKRLEKRANQSTGGTDSPRRPVSPRRSVPASPRQSTRSSPRVAQKSRESTPVLQGKGFPNQASFMAEERRTSVRKSLNVTPQPSPAKASTSKAGEKEITVVENAGKRTMKMKLKTAEISGRAPNANLISKIVADSSSEVQSQVEGLIDLLHAPPLPREISDIKLNHHNDTFTSENRLMQMEKSKESPKVPKKMNIPQIVTPVNYQLAVSGLTLMLESDQKDFEHQCTTSVLSATSEHAVLILPVLDRYLSSYVWVLKNTSNGDVSKTSNNDSAGSLTQNICPSLESLTNSLRSLLLRGENVGNLLESSAINTLKVLYNLVKYSSHVRQALICDTYPNVDLGQPKYRTCAGNTEDKQTPKESAVSQLSSKTKCAKGSIDKDTDDHPIPCGSSTRSGTFLDVVSRRLNIRKNLIRLAQPHLENKDPAKGEVVLMSLKILALLVESCKTQDEFQRFDSLMHSPVQSDAYFYGSLLNCLSENNKLTKPTYYHVIGAALDVMIALANNIQTIWEMCSRDECLLSAAYNLHHVLEGMSDHELKSRVTLKLIVLLSTICCIHKRNVGLLFERGCKCNQEVVKGVVVTLHEELLRWRCVSSRISAEALRQGVTLLHAIVQQDKLFKKHKEPVSAYYKELVCGLEKVIQTTPDDSADTEVLAAHVRDLFEADFDYVDPRKCSSSKESPEAMEQE